MEDARGIPRPRAPRPRRAGDRAITRTVPLQAWPPPLDLGCPPPPSPRDAPGGTRRGRLAAHAAALVRHPLARRRCGPPCDPGTAGARLDQHDSDLHSGRVAPAETGLRAGPSAGLKPSRHLADSAEAGKRSRVETNLKAIELRDLWRRYKEDGDSGARERLVLAYSPLVKYVAGRMGSGLPAHVEEADLISYGLGGLITAIERFEPERGIKFETFAITRIKGSIIDELRSLDWVPRSVRSRAKAIERASGKLEHLLHRAPTDEELAEELELSVEEFEESLIKIANSSVIALDELWTVSDESGDQVSLLDTIEDENAAEPSAEYDAGALKDHLSEAIARLPEREKLVVALYYYESLTLREIGEVLGVTESRVSQLHTKAILRLKARLQEEPLPR
ncbi:MAG: RNA polymerase sigma factor WhiG [Thermoleophilaceae bacterium]|nr:RNA polymerase sigma factor WhiG [Thermoleophilaceae bacterium]